MVDEKNIAKINDNRINKYIKEKAYAMREKKKKKQSIKALIVSDIMMVICICMLLYPIGSDIWNEQHTSKMFGGYQKNVENMDQDTYDQMLKQAEEYNESLRDRGASRFTMSEEERQIYENYLKIPGTDVMGYITCDKIGVKNMPIYHGTGSAVLQSGVGHYEGSSLPVGGESTHCVLSGHTGMAGLKMFSELTKLEKGDLFQIKVLDKTLTYQVDDIHQVNPDNLSYLGIEEGKDYCTLITCIPIGLNSQRLLVRGERVDNPEELVKATQEEKINIFEKLWSWLMSRFAVYELVMTLIAVLIILLFIIPDIRKIAKTVKE